MEETSNRDNTIKLSSNKENNDSSSDSDSGSVDLSNVSISSCAYFTKYLQDKQHCTVNM